MKYITNKMDLNGIGFESMVADHSDHDGMFLGQVDITKTGIEGLVEYWNVATNAESNVSGTLNVIQYWSETPLSRDDLQVFMNQVTAEGDLIINVWYMNAQYPVIDENWTSASATTKLGGASFLGQDLPNSKIYSTVVNGRKGNHVRTDDIYDSNLSCLADLCEFGNFGMKAVGNTGIAFRCDGDNGEKFPISEIGALTREPSDFTKRLHFTHAYWVMMRDGTTECSMASVIETVEEYYEASLDVLLNTYIDYISMINKTL